MITRIEDIRQTIRKDYLTHSFKVSEWFVDSGKKRVKKPVHERNQYDDGDGVESGEGRDWHPKETHIHVHSGSLNKESIGHLKQTQIRNTSFFTMSSLLQKFATIDYQLFYAGICP